MKNIILIEKNKDIVRSILDALGKEEYDIFVADNTTIALRSTLKRLPSLLICNHSFATDPKDENYAELLKRVSSLNIPIIYIYYSGNQNDLDSKNGSAYYLNQSFNNDELCELVNSVIDKYDELLKNSEKKINELRGNISFSLPHEFYTPLNGIIGFTDLLIKEFDTISKDESLEMLTCIMRDAQRLKKLTENFLLYTELELISKDPEMVNSLRNTYYINPGEVITTAARETAATFGRKEDLIMDIEDAPLRMSDDYARKLFSEIINNAFKFSDYGSQVHVIVMSNDTSVMIYINDNGRGMTPEQISSIGAYMQFDRKVHDQQGSGLGLIIAKKITELHGGEFEIESIENEGTKVKLIFDN